jgi:hypothetical protein
MKHRGAKAEEIALRRWKRILVKHEESPPSTFKNEVLGVSDAIGTRMISKEDLESLCRFDREMAPAANLVNMNGMTFTVAGVDWSGGGTAGVSRTVIWIVGFRPGDGKLVLLYYKIFPGRNPIHIIDEIAMLCNAFQVTMVVGDAGEGHLANAELRARIGQHRVIQVQYGSAKNAFVWNGVDRYMADRTTLIDNFFMLIKQGNLEFPKLEYMKPAFEDMLNEFEEVTRTGKKIWNHSPQKPDDTLHAAIFAWVAYKIWANDLKFYQ